MLTYLHVYNYYIPNVDLNEAMKSAMFVVFSDNLITFNKKKDFSQLIIHDSSVNIIIIVRTQ